MALYCNEETFWKDVGKTEAFKDGRGRIIAKSSAALRILKDGEDVVVYGTFTVQEDQRTPGRFRFAYHGITANKTPMHGAINLPTDGWVVDTLKAKKSNAKARLLLMRFPDPEDGVSLLQLTLPIKNHVDSKQTKVFVEAITVYAAHHIIDKVVRVGKEAMNSA